MPRSVPVYRTILRNPPPPDVVPRTYRTPRYRVSLVRDGSAPMPRRFTNSTDIVAYLRRELVAELDREGFFALYLDTKNQLIGINLVSLGSLASSIVHPREVFKVGVLLNASAVVFCHNHPSGDPAPSREDRDATKRLVWAGEVLGIRVLDHIVVGETEHFSFADMGLLTSSGGMP